MTDRCIHRHTKDEHPSCFENPTIKSGIIVPDTHFPIHDKRAYGLVMDFCESFKPDIFVNLGDLGHFNGISHYNKKRIQLRNDYPIKTDFDFIREHHHRQRAMNPKAEIYTLGGNHDETWMKRWIEEHPEMKGYIDIHKDMGVMDYNIKYISVEKQPLVLGKMNFIHGWFTNVHHSKKTAELANRNVVYAHSHDYQSFTPPAFYSSDRKIAWCMGHLSDESKADYLQHRPTNWMLMFGVFFLNEDTGEFTLYPIPLPNYKFIWTDGVEWKA